MGGFAAQKGYGRVESLLSGQFVTKSDKGDKMNKFAEITVIEWQNGKDAETFTSDDDFREGTKTGELAGKTRITWADNKTVEWIKTDMLVKLDNRHFSLIREISDILPTPGETDILPSADNTHASVEAIENALKAGEATITVETDKPARTRKTSSK